ncbi:hypothetical protein QL996_12650 [Planococcus sp. APC 4015]|nr:hypothetical protein [Planococcus sp. APC 4015]
MDFKSRVLIYLVQHGLRVADPADNATKLSDLVGPENCFTDVAGLEPWVVDVRTSVGTDLSSAIVAASSSARAAESAWPVAIMSRRGHLMEDAYSLAREPASRVKTEARFPPLVRLHSLWAVQTYRKRGSAN